MARPRNGALMDALRRLSVDQWIVYLLYGATLCIPLLPIGGNVLIILAGLLALLFDRQRFSGSLHWLQWTVLAYIIWTGISIINSVNVQWSAMSWGYHIGIYGTVYWLMTYYMNTEERRKRFLSLFCITGVLVCLGAAYQYFYMISTHIHEWVDNVHFPGLMRRMYGTLQNPNLLGEYLLFVLSIGGLGTIQVLKEKDWKRCSKMGLALLIMLLCLVLTYSRGMWLSLAVTVFVAGLCVERRLLYALLVVPLVLFFYHGEVSSRLWSLFSGQDTSVMLRWALWDSTMYMVEDFPVFGIGWDAFWMTYPDYNYFIQDPTVIIYHAHNLYLHVAAETGPISLCLFLAILLGHSRNMQKGNTRGIPYRYGMTLVTVSVLVSGLFDHALYSQQVSLVLWQLLGFAMSVIRDES